MPAVGEKIAVIKTDKGDIKVRLCPEEAPKAVENFVTHAENGYYDGLIFVSYTHLDVYKRQLDNSTFLIKQFEKKHLTISLAYVII